MKKMISFAICAIMMAVCSTATLAQENNSSRKQRMSREQMAEAQAKHIAHELALDDAITHKFVTTYSEYQKEIWTLEPRFHGKKHQTEMTDAEAEKAIKERFEHSEKILKIREKYYKEYCKFLTQKQIQRVYELEQQTIKRLGKRGHMKHGQHRSPNRKMRNPQAS